MQTHAPIDAEDVRYKKLDAIDTKCGAVLTVTSILLVFVSLPPIFETVRPKHTLGFRAVFLALLASCLISLFVLFFKEHTSDAFVQVRKFALNTSVCLTGLCCLGVMIIVIASL